MRRKWQGLSPNNPWHVITFTGVVLLLLLSVGLWGVVPIAAMCYVAAALMVRWLKGPSTQAVASAIEPRGASPSPRPAPLQPAATGDSAEATQLRKPTDRNPPAGRAIPSGLFVIMALFLGAGLGLLTGGIVAALRFDEETAAFLGMSSGFFVFATALFCWFPRSRWWRAVVALFLGTCVGMAAGALGMSEWRDYEAALLGVGAGLLSGGLLLSRALRGVGWWRAVASPLIAAGVGLLVGWMAALSGIDEEVGALLGVGCGLLVCAISGYQLAADRPAKRAAHTVRRRSWGHRIGWTVTFTIIVLLVMAMMLVPTATRRHDAATVVRTRSVVRSHGGPHGPACADIEMILKTYPFPNDRARELTKISQRAQLSSNEQVHLIDVALREVAYPNEQVRVLLPLATSPELTPEARFHLSTNIDRISFRSERERIYRALIQNPQTDAAQQEGDSTVEPSEAQSKSNDAVANEPSSDGASAPELPPEKNE